MGSFKTVLMIKITSKTAKQHSRGEGGRERGQKPTPFGHTWNCLLVRSEPVAGSLRTGRCLSEGRSKFMSVPLHELSFFRKFVVFLHYPDSLRYMYMSLPSPWESGPVAGCGYLQPPAADQKKRHSTPFQLFPHEIPGNPFPLFSLETCLGTLWSSSGNALRMPRNLATDIPETHCISGTRRTRDEHTQKHAARTLQTLRKPPETSCGDPENSLKSFW